MDLPLPPELERRWGYLSFIKQRGAHEWSSACPKCGDLGHGGREYPDRFRMLSDGKPRGFCRKCGYTAFADDDKKNFTITDEMRRTWLAERMAREQSELAKAQHAIELLRREAAWLRYHEHMGQDGYSFWASKGVPEWAVKYYQLGWCDEKVVWSGGQEYRTPTATIPVFSVGWNLVNLRHRLINPPDPGDKYRPDRAGLPSALYLTDPDKEPAGETLLVEGEIKAIVIRTRIDDSRLCVVGLPGKNPRTDMLEKLSKCDRIHVILDPDATKQAHEIARALGPKRARVVSLPCKPDDLFTLHGGDEKDFRAAMKYGRVL